MTLVEILIIAVGLIVVGVVVLFAVVFARISDLAEQLDILTDLYTDQGESYENVKTTLDILLREHAALTRQVNPRASEGMTEVLRAGGPNQTFYPPGLYRDFT